MGHIIDSTYIYGTFFAVIPYAIKLRATTK